MKLWQWTKGRQEGCDYMKFTLWYFRIWKFGFDAYILKYSPNTILDWHTDPVDGKHYRINIKLKGSSVFGVRRYKEYKHTFFNPRFMFFRPDLYEHKLRVWSKGCTKLSFGFVKFN